MSSSTKAQDPPNTPKSSKGVWKASHTLTRTEISRYGRQLILPQFGSIGQSRLRAGRVLVIGAGGLGSPVCLYLAAAGVGHITVMDADVVEINNLHRQIAHQEVKKDTYKAVSAKEACERLNSSVVVTALTERFDETNAMKLVTTHDVIVDASDNVPTRYLANDAAVIAGKPLVSGSALGLEGQLSVYGYRAMSKGSVKQYPCYRCIFPEPPPANTVRNCSDGGVLGPIVGIIGSMQALEVIKILAGVCPRSENLVSSSDSSTEAKGDERWHQPKGNGRCMAGQLLLFDGMSSRFRTIKLRDRSPHCAVCGDKPTLTKIIARSGHYACLCNAPAHDKPIVPTESEDGKDKKSSEGNEGAVEKHLRLQQKGAADGTYQQEGGDSSTLRAEGDVEVKSSTLSDALLPIESDAAVQLHDIPVRAFNRWYLSALLGSQDGTQHASLEAPRGAVLVDVRAPVQYGICALKHFINVPLQTLKSKRSSQAATDRLVEAVLRARKEQSDSQRPSEAPVPVFFMCRRGVFSRAATELCAKEWKGWTAKYAESQNMDASTLPTITPVNVRGGMLAYSLCVDDEVPIY